MTGIEWVKNPGGTQGFTWWNPITGCLNHDNGLCKGGGFPCYAYKLAHGRLKERYLANTNLAPNAKGGVAKLSIRGQTAVEREGDYADPFYPRFWEERLYEPVNKIRRWGRQSQVVHTQQPKGIFVCDMSDLFGSGIPEEWTRKVLDRFQYCPQHRFYLLTKQPQNLIKFSPFPDNVWIGVTATDNEMAFDASANLTSVKAKTKFISLEPLLGHIGKAILDLLTDKRGINLLIIGACTGTYADMANLCMKHTNSLSNYQGLTLEQWGNRWTAQPRIEWVREIVEAADKAGIPLFLKDNLNPLLARERGGNEYAPRWANGGCGTLRQEMPGNHKGD